VQTRERSGLALAFIGVLAFSFSLPFTVWALESFDPVLTATGRAVIAAAVAAGILMWRRVPWPDRALIKPLLYTMAGAERAGLQVDVLGDRGLLQGCRADLLDGYRYPELPFGAQEERGRDDGPRRVDLGPGERPAIDALEVL